MPDSFLRPSSPSVIRSGYSPYAHIALYAGGNLLAVGLCLLLYYCWGVLSAFQEPLVWSYLCSLSLRDIKRYLVTTARKELQTSSFIVCCAKLVFLPAVIVWQLFEEVRDKLQSKYQELQQKQQSTPAPKSKSTAARKSSRELAPASDTSSSDDEHGSSDTDEEEHDSSKCNNSITPPAAAAARPQANGVLHQQVQQQHLRLRRPAANQQQAQQGQKEQQQQQQGQQRPPLGPRAAAKGSAKSSNALGNTAARQASEQPRQQQSLKGQGKAGAAAAGDRRKAAASSAAAAAAAATTKALPGSRSKLQRRLRRYKHIGLRQLRWWWFCIVELFKFILSGLLPRQTSAATAQQQQQQQSGSSQGLQQGQQQQSQTLLLTPSCRPSRANSCYDGSTPMRVSLAGSFSSSCMSEYGHPWTPQQQQHHAWQQQQHYHHQQQQQQQQQQLQQRRMSVSHSSPSLNTDVFGSQQQQLMGQAAAAATHSPVAASATAGMLNIQRDLQCRGDSGALLGTSFGGWASSQQQLQQQLLSPPLPPLPPVQQEQQQQQQQLHTSNSTSSVLGAAAAATASATLYTPAAAAAVASRTASQSLPDAPADASSSSTAAPVPVSPCPPSVVPGSAGAVAAAAGGVAACLGGAASMGGAASLGMGMGPVMIGTMSSPMAPAGTPPGMMGMQSRGMSGALAAGLDGAATPYGAATAYTLGSPGFGPLVAGWESRECVGMMSGCHTTAPSSVVGVAGAGSGSPSGILFKWLLRATLLYEGYRYAQALWGDADEPFFVLLLVLGGTLAVAGGLPFLLLPGSLWRSPLADSPDKEEAPETPAATPRVAAREQQQQQSSSGICSPFEQQQQTTSPAAAGKAAGSGDAAASGKQPCSSSSSWLGRSAAAAWSLLVQLLVRADVALRAFCSSSFLDTAVSGLIVVGLILGSVVLSVVLLVQVGEESRQAVLHMNTLVRQKVDSEAALRQGVRSLLQEYEGQVTSMLKDSLPSLTQYVESRASEFLVSHNLSRVLLDVESVKAALRLPGDCGEEAKVKLAVQLANSSLATQSLGQQREKMQQQMDSEYKLLSQLAAEYTGSTWLGGTGSTGSLGFVLLSRSSTGQRGSGRGSAAGCQDSSSSSLPPPVAAVEGAPNRSSSESRDGSSIDSNKIAQQLLDGQTRLASLQEKVQAVVASHETASEQLQLAQLRLQNCQPAHAGGPAGQGRGSNPLSSGFGGFLTFWSFGHAANAAGSADRGGGAAAEEQHLSHLRQFSHVRGMLSALTKFDFATAQIEAAAVLRQLNPDHQQQQGCSTAASGRQSSRELSSRSSEEDAGCLDGICSSSSSSSSSEGKDKGSLSVHLGPSPPAGALQCFGNSSTGAAGPHSIGRNASAAAAPAPSSSSSSSSSGSTTSIMRVAQGVAYPLVTSLRHLSSVFLSGIGSTTTVALGTGLGVLRLGLGVAKFLVQLGVFASVLYTLLALDIDPVEQLLRLLPMSEASQDRASRAVTKAMRGVFVSSLKLAAFHAGFTWLTLRAFGTHFVCLATAASAIVAVLPLVPVALVALPAVCELVLLRGAPVKGFVLAAAHLGAYYFGDDLIFREVEPTLPYLVVLGVFGGMYTFKNPLQGVLLGPMVLALLSVGYNLHKDMF